ncbi:Sporulation protein YlmC, PRC-barrel domain family [Halorubrum aquaticum]|uniref:Sporulation protein YlmC, PRC-barrel domain family n=1 Tax=Halorubrum aquaticum TaxID=387340 RepID=A0A1I3ATD3_9EURY|nr:PRC-barrel domain-containing protein [Halorubrum aquaticum]SFH52611.1 Sporulation protein YlmC, PRC-barrel domain family [Halorubrum aquaticum]
MSTVLASALPEKPVLSADGRKLGTVHDLTIDPKSGDFETLLVDPGPDAPGRGDAIESIERDRDVDHDVDRDRDVADGDDETIRIPGDALTAVGDQVIVDLSTGRNR